MAQLLNRFLNAIVGILFGVFKTSNAPQPLPPPPPIPPGVPPTPGPIIPPPPGPVAVSTPLTTLLAGFVGKYNHQFVDVDGFYGAQCYDEINAWAEWIGLARFPAFAAAGDLANRGIAYWVWIANTPTNVPIPGDVVIWSKSPSLPWGHCATFLRGDQMHLFTFDQNWPYNSPCHEQAHSYAGVAGWYRPVKWRGKLY